MRCAAWRRTRCLRRRRWPCNGSWTRGTSARASAGRSPSRRRECTVIKRAHWFSAVRISRLCRRRRARRAATPHGAALCRLVDTRPSLLLLLVVRSLALAAVLGAALLGRQHRVRVALVGVVAAQRDGGADEDVVGRLGRRRQRARLALLGRQRQHVHHAQALARAEDVVQRVAELVLGLLRLDVVGEQRLGALGGRVRALHALAQLRRPRLPRPRRHGVRRVRPVELARREHVVARVEALVVRLDVEVAAQHVRVAAGALLHGLRHQRSVDDHQRRLAERARHVVRAERQPLARGAVAHAHEHHRVPLALGAIPRVGARVLPPRRSRLCAAARARDAAHGARHHVGRRRLDARYGALEDADGDGDGGVPRAREQRRLRRARPALLVAHAHRLRLEQLKRVHRHRDADAHVAVEVAAVV
mmetsp:Transcript_15193/g.52784  ORF Transcript_15193/g.52784 Transcript_15193/m.52784 type:complete len:419 (-) Transcript_15193:473-1729(-)